MNKSLKLMPCLVALGALFLAGCNKGGGGGTLSEKEKQAITKAMSMNVCTVAGTTGVIPGQVSEVAGDKNDYVQVAVKQATAIDGEKFEVAIEWTYQGYEADVKRFYDVEGDANHKNFEFNFPEVGAAAKTVEIVASPSISGKKGDNVKFTLSLLPMTLTFPEWSIDELTKIENGMFKHVSDPAKGYFESNQDPATGNPYCYVKTYGEVVYLAPDGNWGLLADGEKYIELYAGSAYNLNAKTYPDLKLNEKVYVYGEPTHYQGNVQIGYISKIEKMSDPQKVQGVAEAKSVNGSYFQTTGQITQDMNRLIKFSGKYKAMGNPGVTVDSSRGTFIMTVDGVDVTIAYDYHTSKEGSTTLFSEIKAILDGATTATTINLSGTLRWVNTGGNIFGGTGNWTVVPYLPGHMTAA